MIYAFPQGTCLDVRCSLKWTVVKRWPAEDIVEGMNTLTSGPTHVIPVRPSDKGLGDSVNW